MKRNGELALAFAAGLLAAKFVDFPRAVAQAAAQPPAVAANPRDRGLDALVYVQSAAEYRAVCLQTYRLAAEKLKLRLAALPPTNKLPAVVMDLDETVLDNSAFNRAMDRDGRPFDQERWSAFEKTGGAEVRLVPGAEDFAKAAVQMGCTLAFISNRSHEHKAAVEAVANKLLGVPFDLHLAKETSDKTVRRAAVAEKYRVVMWIGDQLTDFDQMFSVGKPPYAAGVLERRATVLTERQHRLGDEWFILPNPLYGEWLKPGDESPDAARRMLRPTAWGQP